MKALKSLGKAPMEAPAVFALFVLAIGLGSNPEVLFLKKDTLPIALPLAAPWANGIALGLTVFVSVIIRIDGHVNPAVTLGMWVARQITFGDVLRYWGWQILGAFIAFIYIPWRVTGSFNLSGAGQFIVKPAKGVLLSEAMWKEMAMSFLLVFVITTIVVLTKLAGKSSALLPAAGIGLALGFGLAAFGADTGGAVNALRAPVPYLLANLRLDRLTWAIWGYTLMAYVVGTMLGGLLAGLLVRVTVRPGPAAP